MRFNLTVSVHQEDKWYVAKCIENSVASHGQSINEALANLKLLGGCESLDFSLKSQNGSHAKYINTSDENKKRITIVPMNGDIPRGTLQSILEQADLSLDDFMGAIETET